MSILPTQRFRVQHDEIGVIVGRIEMLIASPTGHTRAAEIRQAFSELSAKLRLHLALEDDLLYPRLGRHPDPRARELAAHYQTEMGGIRQAYEDFLAQWIHSGRVATEYSAFKTALKGLFAALNDRIHRENTQVYPLADALQ